jgi:uncharacterized protein YkwD
MKIAMLVPFLFVILTSIACTKAEISNDPPTESNGMTITNSVNKTMILQLVNDARKKGCQCGDTFYNPAPPLTWNDLLEKAALNHAKDMYQNNFFSHFGNDGSNAAQRFERAGYNWRAYGENIGMGYKNEKEVVEGWLSSPGHCKNIMDRKFTEMAVARVGSYWTQTFGAR